MFRDCSIHIFAQLPFNDIYSLALVNKEFYDGCMDELHWKNMLERDFCGQYEEIIKNNNREIYKYCFGLRKLKTVFRYKKSIKKMAKTQIIHQQYDQYFSIPSEIGLLTNLKDFGLTFNLLNSLPNEMSQLTNLRKLYLKSNRLKSFPDVIFKLTNLRKLVLNENEIKTIPTKINQLANLNSLSMCYNLLSIVPKEICQLNKLHYIDFTENQLNTLPIEMKQMDNLKTIYLDRKLHKYARKLFPNVDGIGHS